MNILENPYLLVLARGILLIAGLSALAVSFLHLFWALGGQTARARLTPTDSGHGVYRSDGLSHMTVGVLLLFSGLIYIYGSGLPIIQLTPWVARVSLWFLVIAFSLRLIGDFRHVGLFHHHVDKRYGKWENRVFLPLISVWLVACVLSLSMDLGQTGSHVPANPTPVMPEEP